MKFKINNTEWTIEEVEKDKMTCESSEWTQGLTIYLEQKILLLKGQPNIERTLKHELTHVWLYEYGHNQHNENKKYDYEDVCGIVACSNDFINEVVEQYKQDKQVCHVTNKTWEDLSDYEKELILKEVKETPIQILQE